MSDFEKQSIRTEGDQTWLCLQCLSRFQLFQFNSHARMCIECSNKFADAYGVAFESVDVLCTAMQNEKWYLGKISKFEEVSRRERLRILLLASGQKILRPTEREEMGAVKIRELVPEIVMDWKFVSWGAVSEVVAPRSKMQDVKSRQLPQEVW